MKKFIGILSILLACTFIFACSNGNQAQVKLASKKVSGGLDKMISQVKKLEDVNSDKMDLTSLLGEERDTSDGYHCYNDGCYYCENGNCYKCKDCPQNGTSSNTNRSDVSTGRRNVRQNIYPYREVLNSKVPTRNHMTQRASVNLFAGNDYRATRRNLNLANGNGNYNDLRTACNNVCDLNKEYSNTKTSLINNCNKAKQLLERLKNGEAKLSDSDVKTLNSYYEVIKQCTNNISSCKSCKSTVNTIGKKKLNLASNSGSMTADYRNIYNCLDANCNACNNANNSVLDLISFANKLLGEKQDEAMLGTSTGANRYNSARNQFNSNRNKWTTVNDYQNGQRYSSNGVNPNNNRYTNNDRYSYNTNPYTKDIKDTQRYNENRHNNRNITNNDATTLLPTEYEKPVVDNTTNNATQNNVPSNTTPANNTTVTKRLPDNQITNSNAINNSNSTTYNKNDNKSTNNTNYGVTYNRNGNSIANKTTTSNSQTNYTSNTNYNRNYQNNNMNRNNTTYNNSNYNSNNISRDNTTTYKSSNTNKNNATNYTNNNVARNNNSNYNNNVTRNNTTNYNSTNNYNQNATNNSNYNSRNYGTNSNYNTPRNNPRVNYYAPTTSTLRTNTQAYMSSFEPMPLEPQQCEKPLSYGPRQVRA